MRGRRRRSPDGVLPALVGAALVAAAMAACGGGEAATVEIVEPEDGAVVEGPDVRVVLAARGVEIVPATEQRSGTGHHHLFVDTDLTPLTDSIPSGRTGILHLGRGQTEFLLTGLEPGEHRLIALIADHLHVPLDPPAADTIHFTVRAAEEEGGDDEGPEGGPGEPPADRSARAGAGGAPGSG